MINRQKLIGVVASIALAGVGTGLLVTYVRSAEDRATKGEKTVSVLVATEPIPKGTKTDAVSGKVKAEQVPARVVAAGAIASLTSVAGQVTAVDLLPGEQIVQGRFAATAQAAQDGVAPGLMKVTVGIDALRAVGGQVRQGDLVGVLVSFDEPDTTHLFAQKVPVIDVRTDLGAPVASKPDAAAPRGVLYVTLALDGPSVEKVVFAAEHGRLWLSDQPKESNEGGTKVQTREGLTL